MSSLHGHGHLNMTHFGVSLGATMTRVSGEISSD